MGLLNINRNYLVHQIEFRFQHVHNNNIFNDITCYLFSIRVGNI